MLGKREAIATIAVKNLDVASKFYEQTLGLERVQAEGSEAHTYRAGNTRLFVYRSEFAGTNKATAVSWALGGDVDAVVKKLAARGVRFEHYEGMPGMKLEGDVHVAGDMRIAWFKDPDGNIHALLPG